MGREGKEGEQKRDARERKGRTQEREKWWDGLKRPNSGQAMEAHTVNSRTREVETGESPWVQGQLSLHGEVQDSQSYTAKPCLKNNQNKTKQDPNLFHELAQSGSVLRPSSHAYLVRLPTSGALDFISRHNPLTAPGQTWTNTGNKLFWVYSKYRAFYTQNRVTNGEKNHALSLTARKLLQVAKEHTLEKKLPPVVLAKSYLTCPVPHQ